jgi:hypothetical protein
MEPGVMDLGVPTGKSLPDGEVGNWSIDESHDEQLKPQFREDRRFAFQKKERRPAVSRAD